MQTNKPYIKDNKIYANNFLDGYGFMLDSYTLLHHAIEKGQINKCLDCCSLDLIDKMTNLNVTPLFLALQYSIVHPDLEKVFKKIYKVKKDNNTSFDDFNNNMNLVKENYPNYYIELTDKINKWIKMD
jgi:hypothetical protein